jgi:hypothetical protein
MTALHPIALSCDGNCGTTYPVEGPTISEPTVGSLRAAAVSAGWSVMAGKHGKDMCPACRIAEINRQVQRAKTKAMKDAEAKAEKGKAGDAPKP